VRSADSPPTDKRASFSGQETGPSARIVTIATVRNRQELDQSFYYRYLPAAVSSRLPTYWSYHRDYPEGDTRSCMSSATTP